MDIIPQSPYERLAPLRNDYNKRLQTFDHRWPAGVPVTPQALAQDGFYYTGLDDKVQCTHCGGILSGWCAGDIVAVEHRQHVPECPWVRQRGMQLRSIIHKVPTGENLSFRYGPSLGPNDAPGVTRPKFQNFAMESARKASFTGWPTQIKQRPEVLSKAGFFYLGEGDKCKCFYCGVMLWDWESDDDPWMEHAKAFKDCPWIKFVKGYNFIKQAQEIGDEVSKGLIAASCEITEAESGATGTSKITESESVATGISILPKVESVAAGVIKLPEIESVAQGTSKIPEGESLVQGTSKIPEAESVAQGTSKLPEVESVATGTSKTPEENYSDKEKKLIEILMENRNLKEQKLCKICLEEEIGVLFEPCGHICCCASCVGLLQQCPICRQPIQKSRKAFIP